MQKFDVPVPMDVAARHEAFAQAMVRLGNASAAYREVYDPERKMRSEVLWACAGKLIADPDVARRVRHLRDQSAAATLVKAIDLIAHDYELSTADPNEISSVVVESCRRCHGTDHHYQYIDEAELAEAYQAHALNHAIWEALDSKLRGKVKEPVFDAEGGTGFDWRTPPDLDCPHCFGKGVQDVVLHDTTKLSPAGLKLYKSAERDRFGAIKVHLHDQMAARERLYRALGVFKDGATVPAIELPEPKAPISEAASDEDAAREYLKMIGR